MKRFITCTVIALNLLFAATLYSQVKTPRIHSSDGPRADYSRTGNDSSSRIAADTRMEHFFSTAITDLPPSAATPTITSTAVTVDATSPREGLPTSAADVVFVGRVTSSNGFIVPDHTGVYSEFTVTVSEVLKQNPGAPIATGSAVVVTRKGANVYFPSGNVRKVIFNGIGFPKEQTDYVMFLQRVQLPSGAAYDLYTAYELTDGKVYALDDGPQFDQYEGADAATFLSNLRTQLAAVQTIK